MFGFGKNDGCVNCICSRRGVGAMKTEVLGFQRLVKKSGFFFQPMACSSCFCRNLIPRCVGSWCIIWYVVCRAADKPRMCISDVLAGLIGTYNALACKEKQPRTDRWNTLIQARLRSGDVDFKM